MKTKRIILICPAQRPAVAALAVKQPLVLAPFLGQSVLEHALAHYAATGATEISVLASDRPESIRAALGHGERWGVKLTVVGETAEPDVAAARARHGHGQASAAEVWLLDRLPQLPEHPLWDSPAAWLAAQLALLPRAAKERVGMRQRAPGVFVGLRSRIAEDATLQGPCWIGTNVRIGSGAVVGPHAIIEDGSFVDEGAEVGHSVVGPETYVGAQTELRDSFAHGADLLNLRNGSRATLTDRFLLGDLSRAEPEEPRNEGRSRTGKAAGVRRLLAKGRRILRRIRLTATAADEPCRH